MRAVGLGALLLVACVRREEAVAPAVQEYATAGEIVGEVVQKDEPLGGATVTLVAEQASATMSTRTDRRGWFAFRDVPPGAYVVVAGEREVEKAVVVRLPAGSGRRVKLAL